MAYRLIASDIDGTLASESGAVSPRNLRAIARLRELGIPFILATGRSPAAMGSFLPLVEPQTPIIGFNGAVVARASGEVLFEQRLSVERSRRILELGWELAPAIIVWDGDRMFTNRRNADIDRYQEFSGITVTLTDREALERIPASKLIWFDSSGGIGKIIDALRDVDTTGFEYFTSHAFFLEFVAEGVSKGRALGEVAALLGVNREEVIAVGDGMNDLSMLEYAGLGVAMGNANEKLKAAADLVTGTIQEDGLAQVIERFLLREPDQ